MNSSDDGSGLASEFVHQPPLGDPSTTPVTNAGIEGTAAEVASSDRALVHGIAWSAGSKWLTQIVSWGSTIVVARILSPNDYGLVGMAALYLGLVALISEFGIGTAIVTLRDLSDDAIAQLNTVSLLVGATIFVVSCGAAEPLAHFFRTPALVPVVLTLSVSFIVGAFKSVPNAILQRAFDFRTLATIDATRALFAAVLAVTLASLGFHYWSLVLSEVLGVALATIFTIVKAPRRFAAPRMATIATAITFSRQILVGRISWFVYSNADFLVAGRVLGQAALGAYDFAWTLTNIPVEKLTSLVSNVAPTVFASVQSDDKALERSVLSVTEGIAFVAFPVSIGLALVSGDLIYGVFGAKWANAILPLRLLGIYTALRSVMPIVPTALAVRGKTRFLMYNGFVSAIIFPLAFYWASRYGTAGIAGVWVILYPISCLSLLYMLCRVVTTWRAYWRALRNAAICTVLMAACVFASGRMVASMDSALARLAIQVAVGVAVYAGTVFTLFADRVSAFRRTLRSAF
jgi:PST family polysaccharide transporter